jgi:hypothetical protein
MCSEEILVGILLRIGDQVENPRHPKSRDGVEGVHLPDEVQLVVTPLGRIELLPEVDRETLAGRTVSLP